MATENGNNVTETPVDAVATTAPEETPAADLKGKGKGKAVATAQAVPEDVAMDEDDDDEEEDEEVSKKELHLLRLVTDCPSEVHVPLTNAFTRSPRMVCLLQREFDATICDAIL